MTEPGLTAIAEGPLRVPRFAEWNSFPFEAEGLVIKSIDPPVLPEPERRGVDPAECHSCTRSDDDGYLWVDERWRIQASQPTGSPMLLFLTPRAHHDTPDLPLELTSELGTIIQRMERAILGLGGVGRVHLAKWGDGGYHAHWWVYARPEGQLQMLGTFMSIWDEILPVPSDEVWAERVRLVGEALVADGGWLPAQKEGAVA